MTENQTDEESEEILFEDNVERRWAESPAVSGVDPELMEARRGEDYRGAVRPEGEKPAAFSSFLIPYSALLTGPLVAALVTILADGRPPRARHAVAVFSVGVVGWLLNQGMDSIIGVWIPQTRQGPFQLAVLIAVGVALWAIYVFWMKGRRGQDKKTLSQSVIVLVVLSGAYWFGQDMSWWTWLGR